MCFITDSFAGSDYTNEILTAILGATGSRPVNTQSITFATNITNNDIVELTETFNATFQLLPAGQLSLSYMSTTTATFVILDDDGETLQLIS